MKERAKVFGVLLVAIVMLYSVFVLADPIGADLTRGADSRRVDASVGSQTANAGNVTQLDIDQVKITQIWQGFYGNISGTITLDNADNDTFYDWSMATISGEIFATRTAVSSWSSVNCSTSAELQAEETSLGITNTWSDSINETFDSTSHPDFFVASRNMTTCYSTQAYNSGGTGEFWNVMLNTDATNVVYTTIISDDGDGFNGDSWDFELLVPTNYSASGVATYYFYAELD